MPSVLFEILLAHFLGDFIFQSNDLIQRKYKGWLGTFEDVCIIAFFTILFLFPYWNHGETWIGAATIFLTPFLQDLLKIKYDVVFNSKTKSTLPFFADQAFHIGLIAYLATLFRNLETIPLPDWVQHMYFSQLLTMYLLGLVLFSYVFDLTLFQFARKKSKKVLAYEPNFKGMRSRVMWFSIAYVLFLVVNGSLV